jgi:DNA-binding CsgD family transcriptional regulator
MAKNKVSWLGYIDAIQKQSYTPDQLDTDGLARILKIDQLTDQVFSHSIPWFYLLDYTSGKYLLISKSIKMMLGYEPDVFMNEGLPMASDKFHKDHLRVFDEEIFSDRLNILKKIPREEHAQHIFSYNFLFKNKNGEYQNLLQRNCFVKSDSNGNPLLSFGVITNVNHFKNENPIIQVVEKMQGDGFFGGTNLVSKKAYYLHDEDKLLTRREKELLLWMAEGLTSKDIAEKLFISEFTVINHRRNMIEKCNVRNVTELVSYAIRHQII